MAINCSREMGIDIDFDKYLCETLATLYVCSSCYGKYTTFIKKRRPIFDSIKKGLNRIVNCVVPGQNLMPGRKRRACDSPQQKGPPPKKRLFGATIGSPGVTVSVLLKYKKLILRLQ